MAPGKQPRRPGEYWRAPSAALMQATVGLPHPCQYDRSRERGAMSESTVKSKRLGMKLKRGASYMIQGIFCAI